MKRVVFENPNTSDYWDAQHRQNSSGWDAAAEVCEAIAWINPPKGGSVMDVGVGRGDVLMSIHRLRPDLELNGGDHSEVAINRLAGNRVFKSMQVMDIMAPPPTWGLLPLRWDIVISTETLEHVEYPEFMISKLRKAARRAVIISTPNQNLVNSSEHVWSFTQADIEDMLFTSSKDEGYVKVIKGGYLLLGVVHGKSL